MRNSIKTAFVMLAVAVAASCAKEEGIPDAGNMIDVEIGGVIEGYMSDDTKAVAQNVVRVMWNGGERVNVFEGKKYLGCLWASVDEADRTYARLSGTILAPVGGGKPITLVYDSDQHSGDPVPDEQGRIFSNFADQINDNIRFIIYGVVSSLDGVPAGTGYKEISNQTVKFSFATSVFKCNCACLPDDGFYQAEIRETNTRCVITLSDYAYPTFGGSDPGPIRRRYAFTDADHGVIFSVGLPPSSAVESRTVRVMTSGGKEFEAPFPKTAFESAKSYNALVTFHPTAGTFSVADDRRVCFARGNLWYNRPDDTYSFEKNQYDYTVGEYHSDGGYNNDPYWESEKDHISHFFWRATASLASSYEYVMQEGPIDPVLFTNSTSTTPNPDFSVIVDGERQTGVWRILSPGEWDYLLNARVMKYGRPRYTCVVGAGIEGETYSGLFIYPDDYNLGEMGSPDGPDTWEGIDEAGIIFLPSAGVRSYYWDGDKVYNVGKGSYWACAVNTNPSNPYGLDISNIISINSTQGSWWALSIRMVKDIK